MPLVLEDDLTITLRRSVRRDLSVVARVEEPLPAPLAAGDRVGTLVITAPGSTPVELPLLAGADVEQKGFFARAAANAGQLLFGWLE